MKVYIETTNPDVIIPHYACNGDAGMDIYATEDYIIAPGETHIFKTNLKMAIPEGYELQVRPRSGASVKTFLRVANAPGTVDSGYRDEIGVIITNTSKDYYWENNNIYPISNKKDEYLLDISGKGVNNDLATQHGYGYYQIRKGDRIAQFVLCKYENMELQKVDSVASIGENRGGGFGHTGVN